MNTHGITFDENRENLIDCFSLTVERMNALMAALPDGDVRLAIKAILEHTEVTDSERVLMLIDIGARLGQVMAMNRRTKEVEERMGRVFDQVH